MKKGYKWNPAVSLRREDNIISSLAREKGETGFTPSYEKEPRENMTYIMSNEYMRVWFREMRDYAREAMQKSNAGAKTGNLQRRFVKRPTKSKRAIPRQMPIISIKRFEEFKKSLNAGKNTKTQKQTSK